MTTHDEHTEGAPTFEREDDAGRPTGDLRSEHTGSVGSVDPSLQARHGETRTDYDDGGRHTEIADTQVGDGQVGDGAPPRPHTSEWESPAPAASSTTSDSPGTPRSEAHSSSDASLFEDDELAGWRARWDHVQAGFVDDPKDCVQKADSLVSDVVSELTRGFTDARARLEEQWGRGQDASTEDLRLALKRYREFFERLLAV
jgi:hypothetical protein